MKMWAYLRRLGVPVARCTLERLMRANGRRGVTRARKARTTVTDPAAARAPDLVGRCFTADRPDALWVADFTYVAMVVGFGYTAFVIDAFAGYVTGWECSLSKRTTFVESTIRQAAALRRYGADRATRLSATRSTTATPAHSTHRCTLDRRSCWPG